ncbi:MAG: hypothetical protein AAF703_03705 [Cyanobacteria bacterium P01_D01_bin.105]
MMMTSATFSTSMEAQQAAVLLEGYHFELGHHDARQWVSLWLESYRPNWIRDAVIEALYQGRYKSVSVKQILEMWQRRGQPIRHATHDFESAVCREFGEVRLAPIPPEKLSTRSIARPRTAATGSSSQGSSNGQSVASQSNVTELRPRHHASQRQLRPNAAVSFNLSTLPPVSPGMAARGEAVMNQTPAQLSSSVDAHRHQNGTETANLNKAGGSIAGGSIRDNRDWREFPGYTAPTHSTHDPEEVLKAQRQFNGVLYSSARAIQPFKPALPFSAQTLRLAKQKAIALINQAQQDSAQPANQTVDMKQ